MPARDLTCVIFVRADRALVEALDGARERLRRERPGARVSRSDVVREFLWEAIDARKEAKAEAETEA